MPTETDQLKQNLGKSRLTRIYGRHKIMSTFFMTGITHLCKGGVIGDVHYTFESSWELKNVQEAFDNKCTWF